MSNYDIYKDENNSNNNIAKPVKMIPKYVLVIVMVVLMITLTVAGIFIGYNINSVSKDGKDLLKKMPALEQIYKLIDQYYYEEISWEELELQVAAALANVDIFSGISISASSSPFNAGFTIRSNAYNELVITNIVKDSPADITDNGKNVSITIDKITKELTYQTLPSKQDNSPTKLERGDKIIAARDMDVTNSKFLLLDGLMYEIATNYLSNSMHVEVIVEKFDGSYMLIQLSKSLISSTISEYKYLGDGVGYISLLEFDVTYIDQIYDTFYQFINDTRAQKLVFDLRNNGGGDMLLLQYIAEFFIDKKGKNLPLNKIIFKDKTELVDYAEEYIDPLNRKSQYFGANKLNYELAILVNGNSASASEAFLGAVRYYQPDNSVVVGSPTYGKGVCQLVFPNILGDNVIMLTAGKYYLPVNDNGKMAWKNFHTIPMIPDYNYSDADKQEKYYGVYRANLLDEVDVAKAIELLNS